MGSVRDVVDKMRITIQLVKADDKNILFSEQYDKSIDEIFDTQDMMVQQIVSALQQEINFHLLSYSYSKETVNLAAYENWLVGMTSLKKGTPENDEEARRYFEAALEIDPHYAPAYTGLSLCYFNEWSCQLWQNWDVARSGAHKYALKAVEIDKNDYRALAVLGKTYLYMHEYEKAEHCVRKSLRMNPSDADNLIQIAFVLIYLGYPEEALNLYRKARQLDPFHNESYYYAYAIQFYFETGEFEKSIERAKKIEITAFWTDLPAFVAAAYYHQDDYDNMWKCWDQYLGVYEANVYPGYSEEEKTTLVQDALGWMACVNPYQGETKLRPFWDYIREHKNIGRNRRSGDRRKEARVNSQDFAGARMIFNKDLWELSFNNHSIFLKDAKGLHDIHKLLAEPEREFHSMELMGASLDSDAADITLDAKAKAQYQSRIRDLRAEINAAEDMNDSGRLVKLQEEYDAILDHLSSALGLTGKTRKVGSTAEKARSAITWRIRSALKKIEKAHPEMAKHLSKSIKTGTFCSYNPEIKIEWQLK